MIGKHKLQQISLDSVRESSLKSLESKNLRSIAEEIEKEMYNKAKRGFFYLEFRGWKKNLSCKQVESLFQYFRDQGYNCQLFYGQSGFKIDWIM